MENAEKELLEQHGFDVDGTMKRFLNNEMLYKKCLKKFLNDKSILFVTQYELIRKTRQ